MGDSIEISHADVDAHLGAMQEQPWWGLVAGELALPSCPVCGDRQTLLIDGTSQCESGPQR